MMKRIVSHIVIIIAAIAVFFTGAGVTIVNYCCTQCAEQIFSFSDEHNCCSQIHSADASVAGCCKTVKDDACSQSEIDNHCSASRLSIDIDAFNFKPQLNNPFLWVASVTSLFPLFAEEIGCTKHCAHLTAPPTLPPRDYLALIRILII